MSCSLFFDVCTQKEITKPISNCKVSEGRSTFILSAKRPLIFEKVKFDNCKCEISQPNDERCDWVIGPKDHEKLYFVELKGGDIVKALGQLESAVKIIKPSKKFECHMALLHKAILEGFFSNIISR
ncbi:hypothetical protein [Acinetobacter radioresistens]|uniref:hypothetical protein n=1 Tax=Acinetobacter radioresistens TaxID=40216 RepID=UPI000D0B6096|nr:hypothetical protein [Acinetobacter radioresistens]PSD34059.1 hypothetical protein C7E21_16175 [Acinetobacter radioresistens]